MNFATRGCVRLALVIPATLLIGITSVEAADRVWNNTNGSWNGANNWSGGQVPGPGDRAIFDILSGTITFPTNVTIDSLVMAPYYSSGASATFELNGHDLWVTNQANFGQNYGADAHLYLHNGRLTVENLLTIDYGSEIYVENGGNLNLNGAYRSSSGGGGNSSSTNLFVNAGGIASIGEIDGEGSGGTHIQVTGGGILTTGTANFSSGWSFSNGANNPLNRLLVSGAGSRWSATGNIGLLGDSNPVNYSRLTVENGGLVDTAGMLTLSAQGQLVLTGGTIEANAFHSTGTMTHAGGTLRINAADPAPSVFLPGAFYHGSSDLVVSGSGTGSNVATLEFVNGAFDTSLESLIVGAGSGHGEVHILSGSSLSLTANAVVASTAGSQGSITVDGAGSTMTNSTPLFVADNGFANMFVSNGAQVSNAGGQIGASAGSTGNVFIVGPGSLWDNGGNSLRVGNSGNGNLTISNGGVVTSSTIFVAHQSSSSANVYIAGEDSTMSTPVSMYIGGNNVGAGGQGTVTIADSGELSVGLRLRIWESGTLIVDGGNVTVGELDRRGALQHNDGTITVSGGPYTHNGGAYFLLNGGSAEASPTFVLTNGASASIDSTNRMIIGSTHRAFITIEDGSTLTNSTYANIAEQSGSTGNVIVRDPGSLFYSNSVFYVGVAGTGELNVSNGASVSSLDGFIGNSFDTTGSGLATITGAGSNWTTRDGEFHVGRLGSGSLIVSDGGQMLSGISYIASTGSEAVGDATVSGEASMWATSDDLIIGGDASDAGGTGTLTVRDNGEVSVAGTVLVWGGSTLSLDGGNANAQELDLCGALNFTVGESGSYVSLAISGQATLAGTLEVLLDEFFTPVAGNSFQILTAAGGIIGEFTDVTLPDLPGTLEWNFLNTATSIELSVIDATLSGDFDNDGDVDGRDFLLWQRDPSLGNLADWQTNYGTPALAAVSDVTAATVPEPSGIILIVVASLGLIAKRHARQLPMRA